MAWFEKVLGPTLKYTLIFGLPPVIPGVLAGWFSGGCCTGSDTSLLERIALTLSPPLVLMKLTGFEIRFANPVQGLWFALFINPVFYLFFFGGFSRCYPLSAEKNGRSFARTVVRIWNQAKEVAARDVVFR